MKPSHVICPSRYRFLKGTHSQPLVVLDVGCGPNSFSTFRRFFPSAIYHGADSRLHGAQEQYSKMDRFFELNLETSDLAEIPNAHYDAIVFSHTIEHLLNGDQVLQRLIAKLKVGGRIYVELPSVRSLHFPSAYGTLNFFDDPTHIRMYDLKELSNLLLASSCRVLKAGKVRSWLRFCLLGPAGVLYNLVYFPVHRRLSSKGLQDLFGFSDFILAERHEIPRTRLLGEWKLTLEHFKPK